MTGKYTAEVTSAAEGDMTKSQIVQKQCYRIISSTSSDKTLQLQRLQSHFNYVIFFSGKNPIPVSEITFNLEY